MCTTCNHSQLEYTKTGIPASLLRNSISGVCIDKIIADSMNNTGEILLFDSTGIIELNSTATHLPTLRGSFGTNTDPVLKNMPLGLSFVVKSMKVVHYSGLSLNPGNMTIRLYRANPYGQVKTSILSIEEGMNPRDPHQYILDFYDLDWMVDPYFGISFSTPLEGTFGASFEVKIIQSELEAIRI